MEVIFCKYLINIGLINKESFTNLINEYHKNYSNNDNFLDKMTSILSSFIENLSTEEKKYMSSNLVQYYLQFIKNKKLCRLKAIYMLYKGNLSLIKFKYLHKWRILTITNRFNEKIESNNNDMNSKLNYKIKKPKTVKYRNKQNELSKYKYNFLSMKFDNKDKSIDKFQIMFNNYNYNKKNHHISSQNESSTKKFDSTKDNSIARNKKNISELQTSLALKEQEELKECTFSPKINKTSRIKSTLKLEEQELSSIKYSNSNKKMLFEIFDKLNNKNILQKNKTQEKYEKKFKEEKIFKPKINNSFTKKYSKNNKSFTERQKSFLDKKEKNSEKIKKILDEKFSKICSFVPEINISLNDLNINKSEKPYKMRNINILKEYYTHQPNNQNKNSGNSPFERLYEESKDRNIRKIQREKDYNNYLIEMANISCKKDNNNNVDYNKLNELYLYSKKRDIMKRTKKKVEDEEGSTFRPDIYINECSKNINSDFFERNEKFLKDKQNFIEFSLKERDKIFNKEKFSKEQKKEIVTNIIKRLTNDKNN